MLVKFIDEHTIEFAPKIIRDENKVYANPSDEVLKEFGYKPLVETECPEKEGFWYSLEYKESKKEVSTVWKAHEITDDGE